MGSSARILLMVVGALATAAPAEGQLPPARTGLLYITGFASNNVGEFQPDGTFLRTITATGLTQPRGLAIDGLGNLAVACQGSARVLVLDVDGGVVGTVIHPDLTSPTGIARSPGGQWYVANFSPGRVVVFDGSWNHVATVNAPAPGLSGANCVAFDPGGAWAVTAAGTNQVHRFSAANAWLGAVSDPSLLSPMSIALDSQGNHYVSNGGSQQVTKFDTGWNFVLTFGAGVLSGPQGIAVDETDRLLVSNYYIPAVHRYSTQGLWLGGFGLSAVMTGRSLAYQTSPYVLARNGGVNLGSGTLNRPLRIGTNSGNGLGRIAVGLSLPFTLFMGAAPQGPVPANYVLWMRPGEPGPADVETLPAGLGFFSFPTPLTGAAPATLLNSLGAEALLGPGLLPPYLAPGTVLSFPSGLGIPGTITLQGFVLDNGSRGGFLLPVSPTNALVLTFS